MVDEEDDYSMYCDAKQAELREIDTLWRELVAAQRVLARVLDETDTSLGSSVLEVRLAVGEVRAKVWESKETLRSKLNTALQRRAEITKGAQGKGT